ncbi:peptide MFS transporter [Stakelama sediminis]|uniref:POT family proton-dependent oligopeptide transporter n=1 Tax=Stakelama sediminis TaxID=463200 RepID=A0A840YU98_9SPHN|nr:peptide MFS transporter [Stakelama sediminis]MBB5717162.1 POT family proton-dependent oligopeptide transporter [Stakelama sediminis]
MTTAEVTPELDIVEHGDKAFFGHPKGLAYLAFTEAWERFSYYGMQTLLVLYMTHYLLKPEHIDHVAAFSAFHALPMYRGLHGEALASAIFGTYASLVYLTPIAGGFIADRWIGKRLAVLIGAITMALGHFLMAFEASFLFALLALVIGSGLMKGNIASQVGALYKPEDLRRADAFQIFYLGINAGVILSPIIVGTLGQDVGWHWGFGAAGVGMLVSLAIYISGQKYLPREHFRAQGKRDDAAPRAKLTRNDMPALIAVLLLIPVMAVALIPNMQIFNIYLIWGDQHFALNQFNIPALDFHFLSSYLITIDSIVSVTFLFLVSLFYRWYGKHWQEPDELTKIIIGSLFSIGGMLCLFMAAATTPAGHSISMFWPMMFEVMNSVGFAHMLPVSLALFARLAPKALNATVIGFYYLAFTAANSLIGWLGGFYVKMPTTEFWLIHGACAAAAGVVFLLFKLFLARRLMHEAEPKADPDAPVEPVSA